MSPPPQFETRAMCYFSFAAAFCCLASVAWSQDAKPPATVDVSLTPGEPGSKLAPRYSPPGRQLKLEPKAKSDLPGFDHLETHLKLGPNTEAMGYLLVLARSAKGKPYDMLYVDADGTGKPNETPIKVEPKVVRKNYWSSFDTVVNVNHARPGDTIAAEAYPVALWVVVEKESETPQVIRVSRRGFLNGTVKLGEDSYHVILSDSNNDGVLSKGDWWEMFATSPKGGSMRSVGDYAWAGGKAWMIGIDGTNGRAAKIVSFNPGITEETDLANRDHMREDRLAPRAGKPVPFRKDIDVAIKDVAERSPYFLKFETDWCGPCKDMTALVFTAKDVVDAAKEITSIVVDGDERKDLTEKFGVRAYPTGILFDAQGKEVARYVGYRSVKETTVFFKTIKKP